MRSVLGKVSCVFLLFALANTLALGLVFAHFLGVNAEQGRSRAIRDLLSHSDALVDQWLREELSLGQVLARTTYPSAALEFNLENQFIDFVDDLKKNDNGLSFALFDKGGQLVGGPPGAVSSIPAGGFKVGVLDNSHLYCNRESLTQVFPVGVDSQGALGYLAASVVLPKLTKSFGDRLSIMLQELGAQGTAAHASFNCGFDQLVPFDKSFVRLEVNSAKLDWQVFPAAARIFLLSCVVSAILASLGFAGLFIIFNGSFRALMRVARFVSLPETEPYVGDLPRDSFFRGLARQLLEGQRQRASGLELLKDREANAAKLKLAAQVAHDIRSPLAALDMVVSDLGVLAEEKRLLIRSAVGRIRDIANELLIRNRPVAASSAQPGAGSEALSLQLIPAVIDELITEKRTQYRSKLNAEIHFDAGAETYGIFARVQPVELKRVLSNLINNSIEALDGAGRVVISLRSTGDKAQLSVRDNGRGMSPDVLANLGRLGLTHGKAGGSGLGVHHACRSVETWGGHLNIDSEVGVGTAIMISLPRAKPPSWFVPELILKARSTVVILDDDPSIHQIWQERFESLMLLSAEVTVLHFSLPSEIRDWAARTGSMKSDITCLLDYELIGEATNGLALTEELGLTSALLVTSRYEDQTIREGCDRLGVRMIPKGTAGFVPMRICYDLVDEGLPREDSSHQALESDRRTDLSPDAILIDDDQLTHLSWNYAADKASCKLACFSSPESFLAVAANVNRSVPVYVDYRLGKNEKGEAVDGILLARDIAMMGFKRVYIATGLPPDGVGPHPWLAGVRGKEPPDFGRSSISTDLSTRRRNRVATS